VSYKRELVKNGKIGKYRDPCVQFFKSNLVLRPVCMSQYFPQHLFSFLGLREKSFIPK